MFYNKQNKRENNLNKKYKIKRLQTNMLNY